MSRARTPQDAPPETWQPARDLVLRFVRPLEHFLHLQAASGIALLAVTVIALVWANSPWSHSYHALWHAPLGVRLGPFEFTRSIHFWVNDGLMTIFFFLVGLEIRREMHEGELSEPRRAALPVAAALGGMAAPALIYTLFNRGLSSQGGWGVPTATDIAFAVGVLALLGKRVPPALRVLLLALAVIDDIGAIMVITLFYSSGLSLDGLGIAMAGGALVLLLQRLGVRNAAVYVAPGAVVWGGMLRAGIHPAIAGVVLGLLTPARPWFGPQGFLDTASHAIDSFRRRSVSGTNEQALITPLNELAVARREAVAPVVRLEAMLHPWVAFLIMPLFALANAGVDLRQVSLGSSESMAVLAGVVAGLVVGKPLGVVLAVALAVKLGARLPRDVTWRGVTVVGIVAGIGFTMALFTADLAFEDRALLGTATLAVLVASALAALAALALGRLALPVQEQAASLEECESSTER